MDRKRQIRPSQIQTRGREPEIPNPDESPAGFLAWLVRLLATIKAFLLPEQSLIPKPPKGEKIPHTVMAWRGSAYTFETGVDSWGLHFARCREVEGAEAWASDASLALAEARRMAHEKAGSPMRILNMVQSHDPAEVETMIGDLASRYKGKRGVILTYSTPEGVAMRLNRHARRAAIARLRRSCRREERAEIRQARENDREERQARDRARRAALAERSCSPCECEDCGPIQNVCEHGDHEAPEGARFCSPECEACEQPGGAPCSPECAEAAE